MRTLTPVTWLRCLLVLAFITTAVSSASAEDREASFSSRGFVVPYVAQSARLCGGACLAMVMRYWGETGVTAETFDAALDAGEKGMTARSLTLAARAQGFDAWPWYATSDQIQHHLSLGRPVILLIDAGASTLHYVVVTSWNSSAVTFHDPAVGPARTRPTQDFVDAWEASQRWAVLLLPSASPDEPSSCEFSTDIPPSEQLSTDERSTRGLSTDELSTQAHSSDDSSIDASCADLVRRAVSLAGAGQRDEARELLELAHGRCPEEVAPLRELAGLAFLENDWTEAATFARDALHRDPGDSLCLRLLGGSRYLARDVDGALAAWNRLGEPRLDLVQVEGSHDVRYRPIADRVGLDHGHVMSSRSFQLARRRVGEIPALGRSRVSLRPFDGGMAQVDVVVAEKPVIPLRTVDVLRVGTRAALRHEVAVPIASPTGNGELWTARGRWTEERPLVELTLVMPSPRWTGVWRVEGLWERQAYASDDLLGGSDAIIRETRRRTALSYSDWISPNLRASLGAAVERWDGGERRVGVEPEFLVRAAQDRLAVTAGGALYLPRTGGDDGAVRVGRLLVEWRSGARGTWSSRAGIEAVSANAPHALWPGAGVGRSRAGLLRAHPLLRDDVVTGPVFGTTVWNSGVERRVAGWNGGLLSTEVALFLDAAGAVGKDTADDARWQTDAGVELRLGDLGGSEPVRLDLARGLRDGRWAVSLSWMAAD